MSYTHLPPDRDRPPGEAFIERSTVRYESEMREESPGVWTWDEFRCIGTMCRMVTRCHVEARPFRDPDDPFGMRRPRR